MYQFEYFFPQRHKAHEGISIDWRHIVILVSLWDVTKFRRSLFINHLYKN